MKIKFYPYTFCFILRKQNAYFITAVNMELFTEWKTELSGVPNRVRHSRKNDEKLSGKNLITAPKSLGMKGKLRFTQLKKKVLAKTLVHPFNFHFLLCVLWTILSIKLKIPPKNKVYMIPLTWGSKTVKLTEAETSMVVTRGWGWGMGWEGVGQRVQSFTYARWICPRDLLCSLQLIILRLAKDFLRF